MLKLAECVPSTKKDPKMDITVYMDVAGAELEAVASEAAEAKSRKSASL